MAHRVLLTGVSGYLGGDFLAKLPSANLPAYDKLYALVRTDAQAEAVKNYGAEPLRFDVLDSSEVRDAVVRNRIDVVFYLIDARSNEGQINFIKALGALKKETGKDVHFLHTSGAKIFSGLAGASTEEPLLDTNPNLYDIQKKQKAPFEFLDDATATNNLVIEHAESNGVRAYIFAPCIVYGKSEGFGNPISIQTVAIVKAAKAAGAVFDPNPGNPTWPVCNVADNSTLYIRILQAILAGEELGFGKKGYYLASPGSVAWNDIYSAMAKALHKRGVIQVPTVKKASDVDIEKMAIGIECPKDLVVLQLGGYCTFTPVHGKEIGWKAQYPPEHILEYADDEVATILSKM